jgi:HK97 family phage major capsid protein
MTKVKAPTSSAGLEEDLNDPQKLKALWENGPESLKRYIEGYASEFARADKGDVQEALVAQMRETAQLAVADALGKDPAAGPAAYRVPELEAIAAESARIRQANAGLNRTSAQRALNNKYAPGAPLDGTFDDVAEMLYAFKGTQQMRDRLAPKADQYNKIMNAFGSEVPDAGGFLIPEHLRSELLSVALETSVVRPRSTVIPMDSLRVPIPMIDDTSHVSNVFGGVQWYWAEESAALTASQASFGRVVLDAKKLTAYAVIPNELIQDAPAFNGFLQSKFPQAIAYGEDVGFFTGTGVGEPMGFINCEASVNVSKQTGQQTNTIMWENIVGMYARMLPTSLGNAVWVCAIDTFPQLATMALAVGTGGGPVWIGNFSGGQGGDQVPPAMILGRPVIFTEKANALSTAGDINFVDLSYYLIGDRMAMNAMVSEHYLFANDQIAFRVIERVDGRPWIQSAITPHNNSANTLTPFVQLSSR